MFWHKSDRDIRTLWGYTFEWTSEHLTQEQMRPLAFTYDNLASECLDQLDELSPPKQSWPPKETSKAEETDKAATTTPPTVEASTPTPRRDLYALLETHHASDPKLTQLWTELHTVPEWVDWAQLQRGQDVFYRYGGPAIVSLTFQSLVGGMAGWRVVETLARTGGFDARVAKRRLLETFQHILQVTRSLDGLRPDKGGGGEGFKSSVRVRLLHAAVRRRILALAQERPGYFDVEEYGVPINDLDSIGTILSFSSALIWIGFPRQGIWLREQEILDYTALWRYVAYLLGTPGTSSPAFSPSQENWTSSCLADYRLSKMFFESLVVAELKPSPMSGVLANNILTGLSNQPPTNASREFLCAEAWWLNGQDLSEALGIEKPRLWYRMLVAGQCLYFMCVCYLYRAIPSWDKEKNERVRNFFYKMTVQNKTIGLGQETMFEFKYVPRFGLTTLPGGGSKKDSAGGVVGTIQRKHVPGAFGAERTGLTALVLASALVGTVAWFGLRTAFGSVGVLRW